MEIKHKVPRWLKLTHFSRVYFYKHTSLIKITLSLQALFFIHIHPWRTVISSLATLSVCPSIYDGLVDGDCRLNISLGWGWWPGIFAIFVALFIFRIIMMHWPPQRRNNGVCVAERGTAASLMLMKRVCTQTTLCLFLLWGLGDFTWMSVRFWDQSGSSG